MSEDDPTPRELAEKIRPPGIEPQDDRTPEEEVMADFSRRYQEAQRSVMAAVANALQPPGVELAPRSRRTPPPAVPVRQALVPMRHALDLSTLSTPELRAVRDRIDAELAARHGGEWL